MDRSSYPHFLAISTRWKDNDVYGHVNNVEYYSFFDTVINDFLIRAGELDIHRGDVIGLCVESQCTFKQSLAFPGTVDAGLRVSKLGNSSVHYEIGLFRARLTTSPPPPAGSCTSSSIARTVARCRCPTASAPPWKESPDDRARRSTAGDGTAQPVRRVAAAADRRGRAGSARPGELLVRIRAAGLCHSDLSVIDGSRPRVMPMLLGHEATGEVVQSEAAGFARGRHGRLRLRPGVRRLRSLCGRPRGVVRAGCRGEHRRHAARRFDAGWVQVNHHLGVSGFADHAVVSARSAVKIDPDLPPEIAALFGCAVMTGVGAVVNTARVQAGQSAVVFGLGGVGLSALLGAALVGAHPLVAVDVVPEKLALARSLGATHAIDARADDVVEQVREATGGGAHYAFETVGSGAVLGQAYAATRRGGTTVTVGLPHPSQTLEHSGRQPGRRGTHPQGLLPGLGHPEPRHPALHRALQGRAASRSTACSLPQSPSTTSTKPSTPSLPAPRSARSSSCKPLRPKNLRP